MYKKFIALFITLGATCTSSVLHAADSTGQSHHNSIQNIALLLNHQDFAAAKSQADELVKTLSVDDIISLSREDFIILLNYYGLKSDKEAVTTLINKRVEKYPNENNLCSYSVRQYGYARACTTDSASSNFLDEVDQGFVFLIMDTKSQKSMETYIRRLISRAVTLQDKSDLWNLIGNFSAKYPKRAFVFTVAKKKLGKEIVKGDPAWINGYFLQMTENKTNSLVRKSIMQEARKNYRGDKERAKIVFGE